MKRPSIKQVENEAGERRLVFEWLPHAAQPRGDGHDQDRIDAAKAKRQRKAEKRRDRS